MIRKKNKGRILYANKGFLFSYIITIYQRPKKIQARIQNSEVIKKKMFFFMKK